MAIQYAGGSRVNYTFTDAGTRADLVSKLETELGNAGWSTISGGGSADVLMKSAVTADGLSIRLRLYDPGSGNCAQFTIKNNAGTLTSQIYYLLPGSFDWRIVANKFGFQMFRRGAANRAASRAVLGAGTIWVPSSVLTSLVSDLDVGWAMGNGVTDTTAAAQSWRNMLGWGGASNSFRMSSLWKSFMNNYTAENDAMPRFPLPVRGSAAIRYEAWDDGSVNGVQIEAILGWSPDGTATTTPSKWKGQIYDGMVIGAQVAGESTITFDGHTWIAITDQSDLSRDGMGSLYMAVD